MKSSVFKVHLALFIANLIYAGNYTIAKEVMPDYIQPFGFILIRVSVASILFWIVQFLFVKQWPALKDIGLLAICGLFGVAINQMLFFKGLSITTPINASLIMITTPIIVLIASAILLGDRITWIKTLGIFFGGSGAVLLILYGQNFSVGESTGLGDLYVFLNASSYGLYLVIVKPLLKKYSPIMVVQWVFTFGLIFVLPFGFQELIEIRWETFDSNIWLGVLYVVIGTTFFAYLLNNYSLSIVNPTIVSIYIYLQPLLATLIAVAFGKDEIVLVKVIAGVLIFTGVFLVSKPSRK